MKFQQPNAEVMVPDGLAADAALARTTHLGIGAHQDDLEIAMLHGILECFGRADAWYTGVTCTDGSGSPRAGVYASCSDAEMAAVRVEEQRTAARIGRYGAMVQLAYSSKQIKGDGQAALAADVGTLLAVARPRVIYTHNPADKHATHLAVCSAVIQALRALPAARHPERVLGCETWRGLDWLPDARKVVLPVDKNPGLIAALLGVFDSQVAGGKRYDRAAVGRFEANATFFDSHAVDTTSAAVYAMDLMPVVTDGTCDVMDYVGELMQETEKAIRQQWAAVWRGR
jgi:LmbE family N-acetylglucosaminyl deacetylase